MHDEVSDIRLLHDLPHFDPVTISSFSAQFNEGYELPRRYALRRTPVVIGALPVTSCPAEAAAVGASAAVGEGELLWSDILADAQTNCSPCTTPAARRRFPARWRRGIRAA